MDEPRILLTNDDGIDAPGIASLYEELRAVGEVTVVAPAENQSGVGRLRNGRVTVADHPWGHRVAGTPADCVAYGLGGGIERPFDLVVAGVNDGPNVGNYVVGRSGTVGACLEAAFLGVPAVAVSAYHSRDYFCFPSDEYEFGRPARLVRRLLESMDGGTLFDEVDLLNVNAPVDVAGPDLRLTEVLPDYGQQVEEDPDGGHGSPVDGAAGRDEPDQSERAVRLVDRTWPHVAGFENPIPGVDDHRDRYPMESDRRALLDGAVSVSPLSTTHAHVDSSHLDELVGRIDLD